MATKRLIYSFYIYPDGFDGVMNEIHFECLRRYAHLFDESLFCILIDDVTNYDLINKFEKKIISLGFNRNVSFKVYKNDEFRETRIFYNEIIQKLKELEGNTFFAHYKGVSNIKSGIYEKENIFKWVTAMYYFCLNFPEDIQEYLVDLPFVTYGTFEAYNETYDKLINFNKFRWGYLGTYFWVNTYRLQNFIDQFYVEIPLLDNRWYDEDFFGNTIDYGLNIHSSHELRRIVNLRGDVMYKDIDFPISLMTSDEDREKFYEFNNDILKTVGYVKEDC